LYLLQGMIMLLLLPSESIISFSAKRFPLLRLHRDHTWNRRDKRINRDVLDCITFCW